MNYVFNFLVNILAVFRLTELFTVDEGPFHIFSGLREWSLRHAHEGKTQETLAEALTCPYCLSIWFSFLILILPKKLQVALGIAGGVSLIETIIKEKRP
jgi:hypothetical protein